MSQQRFAFREYPTTPLLSDEKLKPSTAWYCAVIKRHVTVCNATSCKKYPCNEMRKCKP